MQLKPFGIDLASNKTSSKLCYDFSVYSTCFAKNMFFILRACCLKIKDRLVRGFSFQIENFRHQLSPMHISMDQITKKTPDPILYVDFSLKVTCKGTWRQVFICLKHPGVVKQGGEPVKRLEGR